MKDSRGTFAKINIVTNPSRVCPAIMKERSPATVTLGHDVGVRGTCARRNGNEFRVDPVVPAILQNILPQGVLADQPSALERKRGFHFRQVQQHVVGGSSGPLRLIVDIRQLFVLRVNVDDLDLINDPITAGQHAGSVILGC